MTPARTLPANSLQKVPINISGSIASFRKEPLNDSEADIWGIRQQIAT